MAFLRDGCQLMGWPNYIQEIIIGVVNVLAVAADRLRAARRNGVASEQTVNISRARLYDSSTYTGNPGTKARRPR
jgi:hypothetical protein